MEEKVEETKEELQGAILEFKREVDELIEVEDDFRKLVAFCTRLCEGADTDA